MYNEEDERIHPCRGCKDYEEPNRCKTNGGCGLAMNIYYKQSDITASLSELMLSPWALECNGIRAAGIQEALHLIQDMINGEVSENMKIPTADVKPILRARWEICSDGYYPYCSNCKQEPQGRVMTDYCPNCGADMREG